MGGPALCVCSIIAAWRCTGCDTPVCEQHRDRYWPGQGRDNLPLTPDENHIWYGIVDARAHAVRAGSLEACTVCRAQSAEQLLERYRAIPTPLSHDPFDRMVAFARAGIWIPRLYEQGDAVDVIAGLLRHQTDRGVPAARLATRWKVRSSALNKVTRALEVRLFRVGHGGHLIAFHEPRWAVSGPFTAKAVANTTVPDPNVRDAERQPYTPRTGANPRLDNAFYSLRWRPIARGMTAQHLEVQSFSHMVSPVAGS